MVTITDTIPVAVIRGGTIQSPQWRARGTLSLRKATPCHESRVMRNRLSWSVCRLVLGVWLGCKMMLCAATIYDNSVNDAHIRLNPGTNEVADEIILAGTERYLTMFSFEFWGTNAASPDNLTFAGAVAARVRFYENDGPPNTIGYMTGFPTPGTPFFDSGWFAVPLPTPRSTFLFAAGADFPSGGLFIPTSDMTWSVQFQGMGSTDSVGVDIYYPPVVGANYPDYWQKSGADWILKNDYRGDFASRMSASSGVQLRLDSAAWSAGSGFLFRIVGTAPQGFVIQSSTNLLEWSPLTTNSLVAGESWYTNSTSTDSPQNFYRAIAR